MKEGRGFMKHEHLTISILEDVKRDLNLYVKPRGISRFITNTVVEKLEEQYKLAAKDKKSNQEFKEWGSATIEDGLDETNEW